MGFFGGQVGPSTIDHGLLAGLSDNDHPQYLLAADLGEADGVASLDSSGKIPTAQLPGLALTSVFTAADETAMLALSAQTGDIAIRSDLNKTFALAGTDPATLGDWSELLTPTDSVTSVFGRTGVVSAASGDYSADEITFTPAGNLAAEDVQAALEELDTEKAATSHAHAAGDITSGTLDDARVAESNVTQHADAVIAAASAIDADTLGGYAAGDLATIEALTGVSADLGSNAGHFRAGSAPIKSKPMSIGAWIRLSSVSGTFSQPIRIDSGGAAPRIHLMFYNNSLTLRTTDNSGGADIDVVASSLGWGVDEWHHVVGRWKADNTLELFIDGVSAASGTSSHTISNCTETRIGGSVGDSNGFYGLIAHPFVAAQALSDAAIAAIAAGASPSKYLSQSTDYYWPDLSGAGPHNSSLATLTLTESGTVGDAASDPTVYELAPLAHTHAFSAITGTGNLDDLAALTDPGADRLLFWDDSAGAYTHLTPGSGLTITDTTIAVGSLNASAITAGTLDSARLPTLGEPITGVSATKSGGTSYLEMSSPLADMSTFTVAVWFKPHVGNDAVVFNQQNTSDGKGFALHYGWPSSTNYRVRWRGSGTEFDVVQYAGVVDDEWQHLAVTYGGGTWRLYVDGVEVGSQAYAGVPGGDVLRLFSGGDGTTGDDVAHPAIWSGTALSAGQIAELAAGASPADYSPTRYYRNISGSSPHAPTVGSGDLSESGSIGDAADDPNVIAPYITEPADGSITFAKMQAVSTNVLLGNDASGTTIEEIACTAAGRALLDDADAAAQRTTLELGTAATSDTGDFAAASHAHSADDITSGTLDSARLPVMVGDSGSGGTQGAVPAPAAGDAAAGKYLDADGTWTVPATGSGGTVQDGTSKAIKAASEGSPAGNTRGNNAVDLQTERANASEAATGENATISGGSANTASGTGSTVAGGDQNTASGSYSTVSGQANTASGFGSTVIGGYSALANKHGQSSHASGAFGVAGDAQRSVLQGRNATTDATPARLYLDGSALRFTIPASTTWAFHGLVACRQTGGASGTAGDSKAWQITGALKRDGSNNTALLGTPTITVLGADSNLGADNATGAVIAVTADDTNEALDLAVTGEASKNLRWYGWIELAELGG